MTGQFGTADSKWGDTLQWGVGASGGGGSELFGDATSTLTLTDSARSASFEVSASSTLALTTTSHAPKFYYRTAPNSLVMTDAARSGVWFVTASNLIVPLDAARVPTVFTIGATSSLVMTVTGAAANSHVYATSTLSLTDEGDNQIKQRSVTETITLTDTAVADLSKTVISTLELTQVAVQGILQFSITSELELTDEARNSSIKVVAAPSLLVLDNAAVSSIKMLSAESTIDVQQTLGVTRPWYATGLSELTTTELVFDLDTFSLVEVVTGLQDSASVVVNAPRLASNIISFAQSASQSLVQFDAIAADAESVLSLTQEGRLSLQELVESQLELDSTASAQTSRGAESELSTLDVQADFLLVRTVAASNTIQVVQAVAFVLEKSNTLCTYSPFIGASDDPDAPTPPASTYPSPGVTPGFRLQYPGTGLVTDELTLRSPNLGNIDRLSMVRINRETRGGTLIVYADPMWPKVESLLLSFSGLSYAQGQALMTFMETHLGEEIRLIDWEDRLWRGVIVNPQDPVVQDGPGCRYTASYEFEGEKV